MTNWRSSIEWWWSPYRITFTKNQILWLLNHIRDLRVGDWPPDPVRSSSYTEAQLARHRKEYKAYVENIASIIGTVERRLLKTGMDGAKAYLVYCVGLSYKEVARLFGMSIKEVVSQVDSAIKYCEGRYDKKEPYGEWKMVQSTLHKKLVGAKNDKT